MSPECVTDALELWFTQAVSKPNCRPQHLVQAMQDDGFAEAESWLLAALAFVRYSPLPLTAVVQHETFFDVFDAIRRHGAIASRQLRTSYGGEDGVALKRPFEVARTWRNRVEIAGHAGIDVQFVSHSPFAVLLGGFLSSEECDELIALARYRIRASEVVDSGSGASVVDTAYRNSVGTFISRDDSTAVVRLLSRAQTLLVWPATHFERIEVSRYDPGAEFREHVDYLERPEKPAFKPFGDAGDRIATLLLYLNEVEEGGATLFPVSGVEVRPHRGSALFFAYQEPDGSMDSASLHAGMPVVRGCKWVATIWVHARALVDSPNFPST